MNSPTHVVFDCMIYAQAIISKHGPAWVCLEHVRRGQLKLVWSDYVLQEIRELPVKLPARFKVTPERVEDFILELAPHAAHAMVIPDKYVNPFDRDDSHYINLAATSGATVISSRDGDLLRLMDQWRPEAREFHRLFPDIQIVTPEALLALLRTDPTT